MGYGNNNRGNYGNSQGGGYQNNRGGGNYGGGRNSGGFGGGRRGGNNGRSNPADHKYVRSSSFTKHIVEDFKKVGQEPAPKFAAPLEPGITEEISISLTADKTQDFIQRLQNAVNDSQGDGGVRLTMYCQHKVNPDTNEEFDGASILIVGKFPPRDGGGRSGRGNQGGRSGRRDYSERQESDERYAGRTQDRNYSEGGQDKSDKSSDTHTGSESQGNGGYTENPGW